MGNRKTPVFRVTLELRRIGYRKIAERVEGGDKVLVYRRRIWRRRTTLDIRASVYPDGTITRQYIWHPILVDW